MFKELEITSLDYHPEMPDISSEWDELLEKSTRPSIYSSFDYILTFVKHLQTEVGKTFFLLIRKSKNQELIAIFPMSLWKEKIEHNKMEATVLMHAITIDDSDIDKPYPIIHKDYEEECWNAFKNYFTKEFTSWDWIIYDEVHSKSQFNHLSNKLFSLPYYFIKKDEGPLSPVVKLSGKWENFWNKHRNLRKKARRIERKLTNGYSYKVFTDINDMKPCLDKYVEIELAGWKANKGMSEKGFPEIYAELLPKLAKKNRAYFGILYDGKKVVSIELSYSYLDTVYFAHGTYNPNYSHLSPGSVSTAKFIEYFYDKSFREGDFLAGYAYYINSWSERSEKTTNIRIFKVNSLFFYFCFFSLKMKIKKQLKFYKKRFFK